MSSTLNFIPLKTHLPRLLQGDILNVYNEAGAKVASYTYDAWGNHTVTNHTSANIGDVNPFRYRGYYYDVETNFYYLNSRYYDPEIKRFISADSIDVIGATPDGLTDKDLYAYCDNNPVMRTDNGGEFWLVTLGIMAIGGLIGGAISAVSSALTQQALTGNVNWASVGIAAASGFVSGAIAASPLGIAGQMIAGGIIGGASYVADAYVNDQELTLDGAILSIGMGVFSGWIGGKGANHNMSLTNVIDNTKNTIARETRRANQKYAQKIMSGAIASRNSTLRHVAWSASARFALGTGISNGFNVAYGKNRFLKDWPSCKPW